MDQKSKKRTSTVGRRTGIDIVPINKTLRLNKDGFESFGDYWQTSDSSMEASPSHMNSSPIDSGVQRISSFFVKNISDVKKGRISFINPTVSLQQLDCENSYCKQLLENNSFKIGSHATNKLPKDKMPYTKGRRTGLDVISGKEIQVAENVEDFKGYWTDTHSEFISEVDGTNKVSSSKRLLRSDSSKLESPNKVYDNNCSNSDSKTSREKGSFEAAHADFPVSLIQSSSSNTSKRSPQKNVSFSNIQTSTASPNLQPVENSEVTSTTSNMSSPLTPRALRSRSPKISLSSKNDIGDALQEKFIYSSCSPKTTPIKSSNRTITKYDKSSFEAFALDSASSSSLCKNNINQSGETQKLKNSTFRIEEQNKTSSASPLRIENHEIQSIVSRCEVQNMDKNETNDNFEAQEQEIISVSVSPLNNNEINRTQTLVNDIIPSENLREVMNSNQIAKTPKSNESKARGSKRKKTLSASRNRDETGRAHSLGRMSSTPRISKQKKASLSTSPIKIENDKIQSNVANETFSGNEAQNRKEKSKKSQVQKQNKFSLSASLSSHYNEKDRTLLVNDASSKNLLEVINLNQSLKTPKSKGSKTLVGKRKKTLSSRNKDENDRDLHEDISLTQNKTIAQFLSSGSQFRKQKKASVSKSSELEADRTTSGLLHEESNSNQTEKTSKFSKKSKTGKRKSPLSTVSPLNNVETESTTMLELRRSKRKRVAPLESWRLERRVFGYRSGEIVNIKYEQGFPEDKSTVKFIAKKQNEVTTKKKIPQMKSLKHNDRSIDMELIHRNIKKTGVYNPYTGGEEFIYLHRPYNTLMWSVPSSLDVKDPPYTITKSMSGELISFGYVEIGVSKKKEEQFSPSDNITFTVVKGTVKIYINKQVLSLKELDKMTVPSGNGYSIKNTGKVPALLSFCTYKVPLFDYQFGENSDGAA